MLNLKDREWCGFRIKDVFELQAGKGKGLNHLSECTDGMSYIGATSRNNGVITFVKRDESLIQSGNCIVFIRNGEGSMGLSLYKSESFIATSDITAGYNQYLNRFNGLFISTIADQVRGKYNFNYKRSDTRLSKELLQLPITSGGSPDWQFMEEYIKERQLLLTQKHFLYLTKELPFKEIVPLKEKEWKEFHLNTIFTTITRGKRLKTADHITGNMPYVSSTASNNGVDSFIGNSHDVRMLSHCLSIANSGSVGKTFYHAYPFVASDHATGLKNDYFNRFIYLFLSTILSRLEEKYSFNREINGTRINKEIILLPVDENANPDWAYMEQHSKNILHLKTQEYLKYTQGYLS